MSTPLGTDRIERSIAINAPREQVWRALSDAEAFGAWFGADLKGQRFAPGERARGPITYPGSEHLELDVVVERVEPQQLLSFRWHPYPVDPAIDYAKEQPTLVTFTLKEGPAHASLLTVVESGFANVPEQRRMEAFRMNSRGWDAQLVNLQRHVAAQR